MPAPGPSQLPLAVGDPNFGEATLILGALLVVGALVAGIARRSFLSLTAIFVLAGFAVGHGGLQLLTLDAQSSFVSDLALVALILILFRDGLEVDGELLQRSWHLPLRKLALAMPITAGVVAIAARLLTDLSWPECFLLGAVLSPTDPVLSSSVVTNARVPPLIRHSLNLESGLNDGLALPAVLAFAAASRAGGGDFDWLSFVIQDITVGLVTGLVIGFLAALILPRGRQLHEDMPAHAKTLYALGVAFLGYGVAVAAPEGNGLIAVFVGAITLGIRRPDLRVYVEERAADVLEIVKLGVFVVFGSLLTLDALFADGWVAIAVVVTTLLIARPVALLIALIGTRLDLASKAFMAWFGPKGVATMTFSLLVLADRVPAGERIFNLAALCVFASILAHGLTDTPGVAWLARRQAR